MTETRYRSAAQALLGARAAERYDAKAAREHFQKAIAAARPQERMQLRRMADASLALAERRADDLKVAVERLGQEAPSGRQLFLLRFMGLVAPPAGTGIVRAGPRHRDHRRDRGRAPRDRVRPRRARHAAVRRVSTPGCVPPRPRHPHHRARRDGVLGRRRQETRRGRRPQPRAAAGSQRRRPCRSRRASSYDHLLLDLDGCLWVGDEPTERATDALTALRMRQGHRVRHQRRAPQRRGAGAQALAPGVPGLRRGGRDRRRRAAVPPRRALRPRPRRRRRRRLALAAPPRRAGGAADRGRHGVRVPRRGRRRRRARRLRLRGAARGRAGRDAGSRGGGGGRDPFFPMPDGPWPGTGAVVAAVETRCGGRRGERRQAVAGDRPRGARQARAGSRAARRRPHGRPTSAAAANAGIDGALVLTGATTPLQAHRAEGAIAVRDSLADLRVRSSLPVRAASPAPHREPERRRWPDAGGAAGRRGGAARSRRRVRRPADDRHRARAGARPRRGAGRGHRGELRRGRTGRRGRARPPRRARARSGCCPGAAATTSRASSASRSTPARPARSSRAARSDRRRRGGRRPDLPRHRELRIDTEVQDIANATTRLNGQAVYLYATRARSRRGRRCR